MLSTPYFTVAIQLLDSFDKVEFEHVPKESNWEADELAQIASSVKMSEELSYTYHDTEEDASPRECMNSNLGKGGIIVL